MHSRTWTAAHRRGLILATCLMMLGTLVPNAAEASRSRRATVFLDGYVGTAPAGTTTQANIVLEIAGKRQDFAVTATGVVKGKRSARQIINDLRPKQNVLVLIGPEATLGALGTTPPGQLVRITGDHRRGSNQLSVTSIGPPPGGAAPAATPTEGDKK